jgi:hypothetical protein
MSLIIWRTADVHGANAFENNDFNAGSQILLPPSGRVDCFGGDPCGPRSRRFSFSDSAIAKQANWETSLNPTTGRESRSSQTGNEQL